MCTKFWPLAPPPSMEPGVRCHGMKVNPKLYLWSKSEWFLISGYQEMDKILHFRDVLDFDLWSHPLAWTLGSDVMEWKLTLLGTYGQSLNDFWLVVIKIWVKYYILEMY